MARTDAYSTLERALLRKRTSSWAPQQPPARHKEKRKTQARNVSVMDLLDGALRMDDLDDLDDLDEGEGEITAALEPPPTLQARQGEREPAPARRGTSWSALLAEQKSAGRPLKEKGWAMVPGWPGLEAHVDGRVRAWFEPKDPSRLLAKPIEVEPYVKSNKRGGYKCIIMYNPVKQKQMAVGVARMVFTAHRRELPRKSRVRFADGDSTNCALSNLYVA